MMEVKTVEEIFEIEYEGFRITGFVDLGPVIEVSSF
jgi:hypothetical protein